MNLCCVQMNRTLAMTAICDTTLHFTHWIRPGGSWHPEHLTLAHLPLLLGTSLDSSSESGWDSNSKGRSSHDGSGSSSSSGRGWGAPNLFARKVDRVKSHLLLQALDRIRCGVLYDKAIHCVYGYVM
jgi:hypothetical protein